MSEIAKAVVRAIPLHTRRNTPARGDTTPLFVTKDSDAAEADAEAPASAPEHDPIEIRARLAGIEILRGLSGELLDAILARCSIHELVPGQALLVAGQTNEKMFLILAGELRVHLADHLEAPIAMLCAGDTVGELSTIDHRPAGATVIANSEALLLAIDETMFWHIVRASHLFAVRLMLKLAERVRANNSTVQANMELCAQLEAVALSDALTGVHSRRWLDETLPRIMDRHRWSHQPLCLAVVDVDHFKRVNDTYGHPTGDVVLVEIAKALRARLRPSDFVARFGGEEFVIILPGTALAGATIAAERIREAVRTTIITTRQRGTIAPVTVSIGLAEMHDGHDPHALLEIADAALYRAKHNGRDRVEV
jgi:diguanylate cyclase (GGDEF)-like protein